MYLRTGADPGAGVETNPRTNGSRVSHAPTRQTPTGSEYVMISWLNTTTLSPEELVGNTSPPL